MGLIDGASAATAAPPGASDVPKKPVATQAADIASATVAARLSGKRVEALSERTETSTTWVNKDGSLTTELAAGPVRFERNGQWVDVDVKLRESGDGVAPVAHPTGLTLAGKTGTPAKSLAAAQDAKAVDLVTLGEGDEQITLGWKGGLPAPKLTGTRAEYVNAVPGADVVVEATRTGFEQYVEIKQRPVESGFSYTLPLEAEGLQVKQLADGSVQFTSKKNRKRAVMPAPVMWDSTVDKLSGEHTRRVPVTMKVVKKKGGAVDLVVTPDAEFLTDPETVYPVTVDPSTSALSNVFDTYVQQGETVDWSSDTELDLGNPGTTNTDGSPRYTRSFITWDTTPVRDALIKDAELSLYNFHSGNTDCSPASWSVWATGAASTSSRWTAQPDWLEEYATSTETAGRDACGGDGWIDADVTDLVQVWASANNTRSHMGLRAPSADTAQWKQVNSANAATNPPKLTVTYNFRPKTGTNREAGPPFFSYGGDYVVNTTRPTLRDTFVDVNGDTVIGAFQIADSTTTAQVGDILTSEYTASGSPASVKVPADLLTNGGTYKFRTSPYDGTDYNLDWSAWKTFTVDTSAPSAPAQIVSTDYPSTQWVKGEGEAGTFTVTPPAGSDHQWLEWSLDGVTWTKVSTDGASAAKEISVTPPKNGTHTLQVRSVDKADNRSEETEYVFHAGPGGFVQPAEGERTARRLPLVAEADAGKYDKVSFSWRRSAADDWTTIPAGHVTSGGTALTSWPVDLTDGRNAALVWNATDTVDPDGSVQIKANLIGPDAASGSTEPLTVVVDRNADEAASTDVGVGSLNLLTGDYTLSGTDASYFGMSVLRTASSREPNAGAEQAGQVPIFGKEWVAGTVAESTASDYSHIERVSDTAVDVVVSDGSAIHFSANAAQDGWIPEPGSESLTLTGDVSGSFTLSDTQGTVTTFTKPSSSATAWQVSSTLRDGLTNSTVRTVSETVTVDGATLARPKRIIAPTTAATAAACEADPATRGCRVLEFVYATATTATGTSGDGDFGDYDGQVKQIRLWATEPGATAAASTIVASYRYDSQGRLRQYWDPRAGEGTTTRYAYVDGRVTSLTPPGELPFTFTYGNAGSGSAAGSGMLLKVTRATLEQGSVSTTNGTATTNIVYDVPVSGAQAPRALGSAAVSTWGQLEAPSDATAVFPADSVPSSNAGGDLTASDYGRAAIHYLDASGRQVNTADPAGNITTTEYDRFGNTVRELTAGNRALALGTAAAQQTQLTDLGIDSRPSAERARLLSTIHTYDGTGTRALEEFGPLRRVALAADLKDGSTVLVESGTSVPARTWTVRKYDVDRPTDGTATVKNQVSIVTTGAQVRDYPSVQGEQRVNETQYNWAKGLPAKSIQDSGGLNLTTSTEYDAQGRVTQQIAPGASGTDAATRVTKYWSADGTGTCQGRPEWADQLCWTGPAGDITGGGSQPSQAMGSTMEYTVLGAVAKVTDEANGVSRATTTTYDAAGRPTGLTVTGGTGEAVPATTAEYDTVTGRVLTTEAASGGTLTKAYDNLGRLVSYTDADGGTTTTEYDRFDRPVKVTDSVPSTVTYTYDHSADPRGLATKTTDSVAGEFSATYDADGAIATEKLPGGYTLTVTKDTTGAPVSRVYTRDSDGASVYTDTVARSVHGQATSHQGWSAQKYKYDGAGRLTGVDDTVGELCTRRSYTFDTRANRTALATSTGASGAACTSEGATTTTHTYDSGDRLVDSGYTYDAFGRTTAKPGVDGIGYYANDLVRRQTTGSKRQTWELDPALRFRSWTVETESGGTWSQSEARTNHYADDSDNPRWTSEDASGSVVTRYVPSLSGSLSAATGKTDGIVLNLSSVHGDVALQLPLDTSVAPTAYDSDEYGNARSTAAATQRYNWLGAEQRSTVATNDTVLMGVRLYSPSEGRFLSTDPLYGGNANAYEYCYGDPVNCTDLSGKWSYSTWSRWWSPYRHVWVYLNRSETRRLAWGSGAAAGFFSAILPAANVWWVKLAFELMRAYAWYFFWVASSAMQYKRKCVSIYAFMYFGNVYAPTAWHRNC